jgi:ornithine cyclodeaminase/alanine dehydrogenase-like protein (mu-crystallin family)
MRLSRPIWSAVGEADIVSCATLAAKPIIKGAWLKPGTHLDLIGSFTPFMREADDEVFRRGHVWLDTYDALKESGELLDPIRDGVITADDIRGSLAELCRGERKGRTSESEITVFKAVGNALSDIAAAGLVYRDFSERASHDCHSGTRSSRGPETGKVHRKQFRDSGFARKCSRHGMTMWSKPPCIRALVIA